MCGPHPLHRGPLGACNSANPRLPHGRVEGQAEPRGAWRVAAPGGRGSGAGKGCAAPGRARLRRPRACAAAHAAASACAPVLASRLRESELPRGVATIIGTSALGMEKPKREPPPKET